MKNIYKITFVFNILNFSLAVGIECPPELIDDTFYCHTNCVLAKSCPYRENIPYWMYYTSPYYQLDFYEAIQTYQDQSLFYRSADKGKYYGDIIVPDGSVSVVGDTNGTCISYNRKQAKISLTDCNAVTRYCFYGNDSFCEAYNSITSSNCHCFSNYTNGFFCKLYCSQSKPPASCKDSDLKFEAYGQPKLNLYFKTRRLFLRVSNPLKLMPIRLNALEAVLATCYSNVDSRIYNFVTPIDNYQFSFQLLQEDLNEVVYELNVPKFYQGMYWCKGFVYPNEEVLDSNVIYYKDPAVDFMFVLNCSHTITAIEDPMVFFKTSNIKSSWPPTFDWRPVYFYKYLEVMVNIFGTFVDPYNTIEEVYAFLVDNLRSYRVLVGEIRNVQFCLPERTSSGKKYQNNKESSIELHWDLTQISKTVSSRNICFDNNGSPVRRKCEGDYYTGAIWSEVTGKCQKEPNNGLMGDLMDMLQGNLTAEETIQNLNDVIKIDEEPIGPEDVYLIARIIEKISGMNESYSMDILVETISKVMDFDSNILESSQAASSSTDLILSAFNTALESFAKTFLKEDFSSKSKNLDLHIFDLRSKIRSDFIVSGIAFYEDASLVFNSSINPLELNSKTLQFIVFFPNVLLAQFLENSSEENYNSTTGDKFVRKIITTTFKSDVLFNDVKRKSYRITGWVPNVFVTDFHNHQLKEPIKLYIKPYRTYRKLHFCSHWIYGNDGTSIDSNGFWQKNNTAHAFKDLYYCEFRQLSHFALLLDQPSDESLNIISVVGSTISLVAIAGIFSTAILFREWRQSDSAKIALSSCTPIAFQILFLAIVDNIDSYDQEVFCIIFGICLHYSLLTQFMWMLVIGYFQYRKFVIVFTKSYKNLFLFISLFCWLVPILPISLTITFFYKNYISDQYCFVKGTGLISGVFLPIAIIVVVNFLFFFRIFYEFGRKKKCDRLGMHRSYNHKLKCFYLHVKLCVFLFFSMGFSWIFGLLNGFFRDLILSYIFSICLSMQGLVLFLYHILYNKDAVCYWRKILFKVPEPDAAKYCCVNN